MPLWNAQLPVLQKGKSSILGGHRLHHRHDSDPGPAGWNVLVRIDVERVRDPHQLLFVAQPDTIVIISLLDNKLS